MSKSAAISEWPAMPDPEPSQLPANGHVVEVEAVPATAKRANKFMAELSRAMQAAVENARTETMARFEVEAKAVVEDIQAHASTEAADLRSKADGDVATIRDWSKAEIARVREETDSRIAARKAALDEELVEHAAMIETRTARVATVVAAFEDELAAFFERLNAEEDPTRIATMAESMPEPPSLADVAAAVSSPSQPSAERLTSVLAPAEDEAASEAVDFAAAEAASYSGDMESDEELPPAEAGLEELVPLDDRIAAIAAAAPAELATTRVVVSGLVSVANIANFKRSLGRLPGVSSIAVASGSDGDFAFTVEHALGEALADAVRTLPGFDVDITSESEGALVVSAKDRDSDG